MKKSIYLFFVLFAVFVFDANAQSLFVPSSTAGIGNSSTGNIGIGTSTPASKLDIIATGNKIELLRLSTERPWVFRQYGTGSSASLDLHSLYSTKKFRITSSNGNLTAEFTVDDILGSNMVSLVPEGGNVGIGTLNPLNKFQVSTLTNASSMTLGSSVGIAFSIVKGEEQYGLYSGISGNGDTWLQAGRTNTAIAYNLLLQASGGNIGIGTTNPQNKLDVAGTIRCTEVKVVALPWSDFVFKPTYKLRTLGEVEQFIKTNNHLPDVPSEKEVSENGVSLGEMNAKLLQKIEELTLYLIQKDKENRVQDEKIDLLEQEILKLKEK